MSEKCNCLSATELAQMQARNQSVQPRYPCPVHPEPEYPPGSFLPRIDRVADFGGYAYQDECVPDEGEQ